MNPSPFSLASTEEAEKAKTLLTASQTDMIWQLSAQAGGARLTGPVQASLA
jgi:hypothetical protein